MYEVFEKFVLEFLRKKGGCSLKEELIAALRAKFPQLSIEDIEYLLAQMLKKGLIRWKSINNVEYICLPPQKIADLSNDENESINK